MIILYRAMCAEEASATLERQSLQFNRNREKCFSPYLDWINTRVRDGKFNNSNIKTERYAIVLRFKFADDEINKFTICKNEWKTNIRKYPTCNSVTKLK